MSEETTSPVLGLWTQFKASVEELEKEVLKNAVKHNASAGVRVRKQLRALKKQAGEIVKLTTEEDKALKAARKVAKAK